MDIPDYIQEEIDLYLEEKKNHVHKFTTFENIMAYVKLAQVVGRISKEEAEKIIEYVKSI